MVFVPKAVLNPKSVQEWVLSNPVGHRMKLTFTSFNLQYDYYCRYDYVEVSFEHLTRKFCGSYIPGPFVSTETGATITVRMHSDQYSTRSGFRAEWEASPLGLFENLSLKATDIIIIIVILVVTPSIPCPKSNTLATGGTGNNWYPNVANWGICGHECWERAECRAWTWNSNTKRCVTMSGFTGLAYQSGAISGGHHCGRSHSHGHGAGGMYTKKITLPQAE